MRPRIIEFLANIFDTDLFFYIVPTGTTLYIVALLSVMWVFINRCEKSELAIYHALRAYLLAVIGGIVGAHTFFIVQHLKYAIEQNYSVLYLFSGTASWGAYMGGIFFFFIYLCKKKLPCLSYLDVLGASLALGPFIGRWSCFLNGCCYGALSKVPWAIKFPKYSTPYNAHLKSGLIDADGSLSLSVHPVQIYSSLAALIVFFVVSKFWKNYRNKHGATFAFYWLVYCTIRFGIEFFRGDVARYSSLTLSQYICLIVIVLASIGLFVCFKKPYFRHYVRDNRDLEEISDS